MILNYSNLKRVQLKFIKNTYRDYPKKPKSTRHLFELRHLPLARPEAMTILA